MAPDEDTFSVTSFEDLATVEHATAEELVLLQQAVEEKPPSNGPLDVGNDDLTTEEGADGGKDEVNESDWVPTNDIHFILRWENVSGKLLKECRSFEPFDIPCDPNDGNSSDGSSYYDDSDDDSDDGSLYYDVPPARARGTLTSSTLSFSRPKAEVPPGENAVEDSSGKETHEVPSEPTGTPVLELCVTVYNQTRPGCPPPPLGAMISLGGNKPNEAPSYDLDSAHVRDKFVRIHSLHIINALRAVTEYYPGIDLDASPAKIPVRSCYFPHIYKDLQKHMADQVDLHDEEYASTASKHIKVLLDIVENLFKDKIEESEELQKTGVTTYDTFWNLLKPGTKAYYSFNSRNQNALPCIVHSIDPSPIIGTWTNDRPFYYVKTWRITWRNGNFCRQWNNFHIYRFKGEMKITKLVVYPARFHEQKERGLPHHEESLGHFCWSTAAKGGPCYLELSDNYKVEGPSNYPITFMSRRLVVDYHHDFSQYPVMTPLPPSGAEKVKVPKIPIYAAGCRCEKCDPSDDARPRSLWANLDKLNPTKTDEPQLAQYYHAIDKSMPAWLLASQRHILIHAKDIQPLRAASIRKQEIVHRSPEITEAIDDIAKSILAGNAVYDTLDKETALGGLDSSGYGSRIILLHGAPGTGKTAAVEQLAETVRRPLFHLEPNLRNGVWSQRQISSVMAFCERVGGIAVIDDADKILGRRMNGIHGLNVAYYGIVKALDSFKGTVFLITNRLGHMDPSFLCRISMALHFPSLTEEQRHRIWTNQFAALDGQQQERPLAGGVSGRKIFISPQTRAFVLESKEIASLGWNGIEIRNALRSAIQLAESDTVSRPAVTPDVSGREIWIGSGPGVHGRPTPPAIAATDQEATGCNGDSDGDKQKEALIVLEKHFKAVVKNALSFRELVRIARMQDEPVRVEEETNLMEMKILTQNDFQCEDDFYQG